jgi:ribosomal protein S12 methylthiotransferase
MYAYPATLTDPILDAMASEEKVVKYVDIPLQHASDAVLRRMKRPTGRGNLLGMIERIRARVPGVAIRTSFIVGFPGETDADFQELLDFVEAAALRQRGRLHVFGRRRNEPPSTWAPRGPRGEGEAPAPPHGGAEADRDAPNRSGSASVSKVLVEGTHPESDLLLRGRSAAQAPDIDGMIVIADGVAEPGTFVTCEVTEAHPYDLVVRIVEAVASPRCQSLRALAARP